jgi:hypothetical protein
LDEEKRKKGKKKIFSIIFSYLGWKPSLQKECN